MKMNNNEQLLEKILERLSERPLQYRIFKGIKGKYGAIRFGLLPAYVNSGNSDKQEGAVFVEAAPTNGPNNYEWKNNKIVFALKVTDIGKILSFLKTKTESSLKLLHDTGLSKGRSQGELVTVLNISSPNETMKSYWINMSQKEQGSSKNEVKIPISIDEMLIIFTLLEKAIPRILAW
jgi:hypothetical protein